MRVKNSKKPTKLEREIFDIDSSGKQESHRTDIVRKTKDPFIGIEQKFFEMKLKCEKQEQLKYFS